MKKIQKNLSGSFNVFSNSARQLEVPLNEYENNIKTETSTQVPNTSKIMWKTQLSLVLWKYDKNLYKRNVCNGH